MPGVSTGQPAPDFTLPGVEGKNERHDYTLSAYRGQPVVVVFYPGDNTPVCTRQLNAYTKEIDRFAEVGAQLLAISPQSVDSHVQFSCQQGGFAFPRRSAFVIDSSGVIRYAHRAIAGLTFRPTEELVDAIRKAS